MNQNQKMSTENQIGNIHEYSTKEKKGLLFSKNKWQVFVIAVKTNERREKVGKNVIFALHIKT